MCALQYVLEGPSPTKTVFTQLDAGNFQDWHSCPQVGVAGIQLWYVSIMRTEVLDHCWACLAGAVRDDRQRQVVCEGERWGSEGVGFPTEGEPHACCM
jgi:hypothetical protein